MKDQKKRKKQLSQLFYGQNAAGISGKVVSNHAHSISQNPNNVLITAHQHNMSVGAPSQNQLLQYPNGNSLSSVSVQQQPQKYSTGVLATKANQSFAKK